MCEARDNSDRAVVAVGDSNGKGQLKGRASDICVQGRASRSACVRHVQRACARTSVTRDHVLCKSHVRARRRKCAREHHVRKLDKRARMCIFTSRVWKCGTFLVACGGGRGSGVVLSRAPEADVMLRWFDTWGAPLASSHCARPSRCPPTYVLIGRRSHAGLRRNHLSPCARTISACGSPVSTGWVEPLERSTNGSSSRSCQERVRP
jgi:hypothetical protein